MKVTDISNQTKTLAKAAQRIVSHLDTEFEHYTRYQQWQVTAMIAGQARVFYDPTEPEWTEMLISAIQEVGGEITYEQAFNTVRAAKLP